MKTLFLRVVQNSRGFSLTETVLGCALLVLVLGIALPNIAGFSHAVDKIRSGHMAYILASDIRRVQTSDMYRGREFYAISFDEVNRRYLITKGGKALEVYYIGELLNDNWSIKATTKQNIFYMRGSVNAYNYIDIYRLGEAGRGYQLQILPVTGRVGVYKR